MKFLILQVQGLYNNHIIFWVHLQSKNISWNSLILIIFLIAISGLCLWSKGKSCLLFTHCYKATACKYVLVLLALFHAGSLFAPTWLNLSFCIWQPLWNLPSSSITLFLLLERSFFPEYMGQPSKCLWRILGRLYHLIHHELKNSKYWIKHSMIAVAVLLLFIFSSPFYFEWYPL